MVTPSNNQVARQIFPNHKSQAAEARSDGRARSSAGTSSSRKKQRTEPARSRIITVQDITQLPSVVLGYALDYLTFLETRVFFGCGNRVLWEEKRVDYDSEMIRELALPVKPPLAFLGSKLTHVVSLDLGPWCTNKVLELMVDEQVLPNLQHLAMARSLDVTDEGLALLPTNQARCRTLKSLDLQYCRRLSYEQTLVIRKLFKAIQVIRRQPPWLDGKLDTFIDRSFYQSWADGTFCIWDKDGNMKQCVYLRDLYQDGSENCVVTKAQWAFDDDTTVWKSQPRWHFHATRIGNRFMQTPDGSILEARPLKGLYPPDGFPTIEQADSIELDTAKCYDQNGDECGEDDPFAHVQVLHFEFEPTNELMPPPQVVDKCRAQLKNMHRIMARRDEQHDERQVHVINGGDENDEPPQEWFEYYP